MGETDTIGGRIAYVRSRRGWTQEELGRRAKGISALEISHYETGRRVPQLRNGIALARALRVPLDYLATGDGHRPPTRCPTCLGEGLIWPDTDGGEP